MKFGTKRRAGNRSNAFSVSAVCGLCFCFVIAMPSSVSENIRNRDTRHELALSIFGSVLAVRRGRNRRNSRRWRKEGSTDHRPILSLCRGVMPLQDPPTIHTHPKGQKWSERITKRPQFWCFHRQWSVCSETGTEGAVIHYCAVDL